MPEVELIGDIAHVLARLAAGCSARATTTAGTQPAARARVRRAQRRPRRRPLPDAPAARAVRTSARRCGRHDILVSDVGLHKLWIGRMFPAHEPGTVLIANGLAGMGFALPDRRSRAKLVHPDRNVVTVSGDGGFLMNCQELETAVRLRTPVVNVIWENGQFGSIVWKQDKKFGRHFGVDFGNPDFVKLAEAFGLPAWRCAERRRLPAPARATPWRSTCPSLIVVPIDYSIDVAISERARRRDRRHLIRDP